MGDVPIFHNQNIAKEQREAINQLTLLQKKLLVLLDFPVSGRFLIQMAEESYFTEDGDDFSCLNTHINCLSQIKVAINNLGSDILCYEVGRVPSFSLQHHQAKLEEFLSEDFWGGEDNHHALINLPEVWEKIEALEKEGDK